MSQEISPTMQATLDFADDIDFHNPAQAHQGSRPGRRRGVEVDGHLVALFSVDALRERTL